MFEGKSCLDQKSSIPFLRKYFGLATGTPDTVIASVLLVGDSYCVLFSVLLLNGRPTKIKGKTVTW